MSRKRATAAKVVEPELVEPVAVDPNAALVQYEQQSVTAASALLERVQAFVIETPEDAQTLADLLNDEILEPKKAIALWFKGTVQQPGPKTVLHKAWKDMCKRESDIIERYDKPEEIAKKKIGDWVNAQERLRQAAIDAAEKSRQVEEDMLRDELAEEARIAGNDELADGLLGGDAPIVGYETPVVIPPPMAKIEGVRIGKKFRAEIVDEALLRAAIPTRPDVAALVLWDQAKLNGLANSLGFALNIPGVRVVEDTGVAGGRR